MAPNGAKRIFVPTNPDLADILGRTDFDFENSHFFVFFGFQISGFPSPQISKIWPGPGRAWALGRVGPRAGPRVGRAGLGPQLKSDT